MPVRGAGRSWDTGNLSQEVERVDDLVERRLQKDRLDLVDLIRRRGEMDDEAHVFVHEEIVLVLERLAARPYPLVLQLDGWARRERHVAVLEDLHGGIVRPIGLERG